MNVTAEQRRIAKLLGIQNIDSQNDLRQINEASGIAKRIGIQDIDSQNDIRQIRAAQPQRQQKEEFDYRGALDKMGEQFRQRISAQESSYAENLRGLEDRLRDMQSTPFKPLERNRVMGIRFAGQNSSPSKKKDAFKRKGQRIQGIRSTAINL